MSVWLWMALGVLAATYCLVRGLLDLRRGAYLWALAGIASAVVLLLTPNPNNKISVTLPIASAGPAR